MNEGVHAGVCLYSIAGCFLLTGIRGRMAESMREHEHDMLFRREEIAVRVAEIGAQISHDFAGEAILLVGVLKGAAVFLADLARSISVETTFDFRGHLQLQGGQDQRCGKIDQGSGHPDRGSKRDPGRRHPGYRPDLGFPAQVVAATQTQDLTRLPPAWTSRPGGWRRSMPIMSPLPYPTISWSDMGWITRNAFVTSPTSAYLIRMRHQIHIDLCQR